MRIDGTRCSVALLLAALVACAPRPARGPSGSGPEPRPFSAATASATVPARTWFVPYFDISTVEGVAWSPDGKWALLRQEAERALLLGTSQAAPVAGLPISGNWLSAAWSRDGKRFIAVDDRTTPRFTLVKLDAYERAVTWKVPVPIPSWLPLPIGFLPDGKRFLAKVKPGAVRVLDAATGAPLGPELPIAERTVTALAWSHPWLVHGAGAGGFAITDVETGARLFASVRPLDKAVWLTTEPKLAVTSGVTNFVWDQQRGLAELGGDGEITWDRRGDRIALFAGVNPSGNPFDVDRCRDCLRPVRWSSVLDVASGRDLPTSGFLPDGKRHELSPWSLLDLETNEARPFRRAPELQFVSADWIDDSRLVLRGKRWDIKVELQAGRAVAWAPRVEEPPWTFEPERRTSCEDDRWTLRDRFSGAVVVKLADTTCKDTTLRRVRFPLLAYVTARETRIIDASSGKTLARLTGQPATARDWEIGAITAVTHGGFGHCEAFDAETRKVTVTPPLRAGSSGFDCTLDRELGIVATLRPHGDAKTPAAPIRHVLTPGKGWQAQDGASLFSATTESEQVPDRPSSPRGGLLSALRTRSGRFVIRNGRAPAFILRNADSASLRLLMIEGKDRPYTVVFDERGRFAGDDEAARLLTYATGTSLEAATLSNGLEVADRFRNPDVIADFFR